VVNIESPFILKDEAYVNYFIFSLLSIILTGISVFLITKGKKTIQKSVSAKKAEKKRNEIRELLKAYFQNTAGNLSTPQKQAAKQLVKSIDGILK
jgi:hypothetical protein